MAAPLENVASHEGRKPWRSGDFHETRQSHHAPLILITSSCVLAFPFDGIVGNGKVITAARATVSINGSPMVSQIDAGSGSLRQLAF